MQHKPIFLLLILPVLVIMLNGDMDEIFGLEYDNEYFLDSDSVYLIFELDSVGKFIFIDGGLFIDETLQEFDTNQVKVLRITENGDHGRIFGKTIQGDYYYVIYDIDAQNVKIFSKLWHNGTVTKSIENATIDKLF